MATPDFILELRRHIGNAPLFLIGITALVMREHGDGQQLLLVRRVDTGEWTPVCGIVEPGEQLHEVAVREVLEETRVRSAVKRCVWIKTYPEITYPNGDICSYVNHTFTMTWLGGDPEVGDDESTDARWWPVDALPPMRPEFVERIDWALREEPGCWFGEGPDLGA